MLEHVLGQSTSQDVSSKFSGHDERVLPHSAGCFEDGFTRLINQALFYPAFAAQLEVQMSELARVNVCFQVVTAIAHH